MAVLEARPLFLYTGNWVWSQPWTFFRSGFYVGLLAVAALAVTTWRSRRVDHLLILCFTTANYLATFGQNRFGYYLVPSTAVVISWLAVQILDWGGVPHADNPAPTIKRRCRSTRDRRDPRGRHCRGSEPRPGGADHHSRGRHAGLLVRCDAMAPHQHAGAVHVARLLPRALRRHQSAGKLQRDELVGPGLLDPANRPAVPVTNPTQRRRHHAARISDRDRRVPSAALLAAARARYSSSIGNCRFARGPRRAGRAFPEPCGLGRAFRRPAITRYVSRVVPRARRGRPPGCYREVYTRRWSSIMVLGGAASRAAGNTYVVNVRHRHDASGREFCEVVDRWQYANPEEAKATASQRGAGFEAVGLTPWQPAFSVPAIAGLKVASEFRDPAQGPNESPMIRIFEVVGTQ